MRSRKSIVPVLITTLAILVAFIGCGDKKDSLVEQVKPHVDRGFRFYREGNYPDAAKEWEQALEINPELDYLRTNLGVIYLNFLDRKEDARAIWTIYMERHPEDASIYNNLAGLHQSDGNMDKALEFYQRAADLHPQYHTPLVNMASLYNVKGDFLKSMAVLEQAHQTSPADQETLILMGQIQGKLGQDRAAMDTLLKAKGYSTNPSIRTALAREYLRQGQPEIAKREVQQILAETPTHAAALDLMARVELGEGGGGVEAAQALLDKASKEYGDIGPALATSRGMLALSSGDLGAARAVLSAAFPKIESMELDRVAEARYLLGNVLIRQGETEEGQELINLALQADPRLDRSGEIFRLLNRTGA